MTGSPLYHMTARRIAEALTEILIEHFGRLDNGWPRYKWMHSDDLVLPIPLTGVSFFQDGDWHIPEGGRILVRHAPWKFMDYADAYANQWVICRWDRFTREQWFSFAGTEECYPEQGVYLPGEFCTAPGQPPTMEDTRKFLHEVHRRERMTKKQIRDEELGKIERREKQNRERNKAMISDAMYSFIGATVHGHGESRLFIAPSHGKEKHYAASH